MCDAYGDTNLSHTGAESVMVTSVGLLFEAGKICGRDLAIFDCQVSLVYEWCFICVCASAFHAPANCK